MSVAQNYYIGNTHIVIRDDCIESTEEQKKILKRCGEIARQYRDVADRHCCLSAPEPTDIDVEGE
jgi:hypothetical protein